MSEEANKQVAWRLFELIGAARVDEASQLLAPGAHWIMMRSQPQDLDAGEIVKVMQGFFEMLPGGVAFTKVSCIADGDLVALELEGHAELPNGKTYANRYVQIMTIRDGLIHELREYQDSAHLEAVIPHDFVEEWSKPA